jgi:hypothetical protein
MNYCINVFRLRIERLNSELNQDNKIFKKSLGYDEMRNLNLNNNYVVNDNNGQMNLTYKSNNDYNRSYSFNNNNCLNNNNNNLDKSNNNNDYRTNINNYRSGYNIQNNEDHEKNHVNFNMNNNADSIKTGTFNKKFSLNEEVDISVNLEEPKVDQNKSIGSGVSGFKIIY